MILNQDNEYTALLDSCVLVPMCLCDTLLRLATDPAMYRPLWSERILQEIGDALERKIKLTKQQRDYRISQMRVSFPEASVSAPPCLESSLTGIPDVNDRHVLASAIATASLVVALTLLATWGHDLLPVVMQGSDYSLLTKKGVSPAVWALTALAIIALWKRKQRVIDLWLMLVMWVWLFDIALAAVIGSSRFDLGFYVGRIFGLLAAGFLLITLLMEMVRIHAGLIGAAENAELRLAQFLQSRRRPELKSSKGSDTEEFIRRQNIARYRALLESGSLDEAQRHLIEKLLSDVEKEEGRG